MTYTDVSHRNERARRNLHLLAEYNANHQDYVLVMPHIYNSGGTALPYSISCNAGAIIDYGVAVNTSFCGLCHGNLRRVLDGTLCLYVREIPRDTPLIRECC